MPTQSHAALRPRASAEFAAVRGQLLESGGALAVMLGGVLLCALTTPLLGLALLLAGALCWVSGWWSLHASWCNRCRAVVEHEHLKSGEEFFPRR